MAGFRNGGPLRRQRGWAGIVMLLVALVVVGFLVRTVLKQMGLSDGPSSAIVTGKVQPGPVGTPATPLEPTATAAPMERARALQAEVLRQGAATDERLKGIDQ